MEVLIVAVNQAYDMRKWYTPTNELQLACLQLREVCRGAHTLRVRVDGDIPTTLLAVDTPRVNLERRVFSRVPRLRPGRLTWLLPSAEVLSSPLYAFAGVEELYFGDAFDSSLDIRAGQIG